MVDFKHLAIDGQKIAACSRFRNNVDRAHAQRKLKRVQRGMARLLNQVPDEYTTEEQLKNRTEMLKRKEEKRFARIGTDITRQDMSNWTMAVVAVLEPLIERTRKLIRAGQFVKINETPNTSKPYLWLARGGPPETQVTPYNYTPTRSAEHPRELLSEFEGTYRRTDIGCIERSNAKAPISFVSDVLLT